MCIGDGLPFVPVRGGQDGGDLTVAQLEIEVDPIGCFFELPREYVSVGGFKQAIKPVVPCHRRRIILLRRALDRAMQVAEFGPDLLERIAVSFTGFDAEKRQHLRMLNANHAVFVGTAAVLLGTGHRVEEPLDGRVLLAVSPDKFLACADLAEVHPRDRVERLEPPAVDHRQLSGALNIHRTGV